MPRNWFVSTAGSDSAGSGHSDSPFKSPAKAVFEAWPGDRIYLMNGVYPGEVVVGWAGRCFEGCEQRPLRWVGG